MAELELRPTDRGFLRAEWKDAFLADCSIQESSNADERRLWLGVELEGGRGRMHLNRAMVAALLPLLQRFVATGQLLPPEEDPPAGRRDRYGVRISAWHVVLTEHDGTSHTVGLDDLDAVHKVVAAQLGRDPIAGVTIQPNRIGGEDLAAVIVALLESCPPSPQTQRAAALLAAYDEERG